MNEADYVYDVFFSYKRHLLTRDWTHRVQKQLEFWLTEELQRKVEMFVDVDTIEIGDRWPDALRDGLRLSRCMVGVWSPSYFQSHWCVSEWKSFMERERIANTGTHSLIAPVRFHGGEDFPVEAKEAQVLDLRPYASTMSAFWTSPKSLELEDKIKELAVAVARKINTAPPFQQNWPVFEKAGTAVPTIPLGRL